jgi:predicted nucleotidyltransferase
MESFPFETDQLFDICQANDVKMLGVFGSMARGESTEGSDVDLLVRFSRRKGLLAMVRLEREMSEAIGKKVDLLTEPAISPYIRDHILNDLVVIYGSR